MEKSLKILKVNLRYNFIFPFAAAIGIYILTLLLFSITALNGREAAKPIEFLLCFIGVALLTPIFLPEQDENIRDVISSKKVGYPKLCIMRLVYSVAAMAALIVLFVAMMYFRESEVTAQHVIGGIACAGFLGSIGFMTAGITNNTTLGYMAAMLYYLANYGLGDKLGKLYIFPMSGLGVYDRSLGLIAGGVVLCGVTLGVVKMRRRGAH